MAVVGGETRLAAAVAAEAVAAAAAAAAAEAAEAAPARGRGCNCSRQHGAPGLLQCGLHGLRGWSLEWLAPGDPCGSYL